MNEVVKAILNHKYIDEKMKKQVFICKRTKNQRIKDKAFTKLFYMFMEETQSTVVGKVVFVKSNYYFEFNHIKGVI